MWALGNRRQVYVQSPGFSSPPNALHSSRSTDGQYNCVVSQGCALFFAGVVKSQPQQSTNHRTKGHTWVFLISSSSTRLTWIWTCFTTHQQFLFRLILFRWALLIIVITKTYNINQETFVKHLLCARTMLWGHTHASWNPSFQDSTQEPSCNWAPAAGALFFRVTLGATCTCLVHTQMLSPAPECKLFHVKD